MYSENSIRSALYAGVLTFAMLFATTSISRRRATCRDIAMSQGDSITDAVLSSRPDLLQALCQR